MASELLASSSAGSLSDLTSRFDNLASRIRRVALLRGLGRLAAILAVMCAAGFVADWLWPLPAGVRMGWLGAIVAVGMYTLITAVLRPVFRQFSAAELAAIVEAHYPELGERLTSAVELTDPSIPEDHKGSALMREWLEAETVSSTRHMDFKRAVPSERARISAWIGGIAAAVLLAPFLVMPAGYGLLWARLLLPWGTHELPAVVYFHVPDGDRVAARGEELTLLALPPSDVPAEDLPEAVDLVWTNSAGETDRRAMTYDANQKAFVVTLPHVFEDFEYMVTATRKRSDRHKITVVDRPEITGFTLTITPPGYTGLESSTVDGAVGNVMAFERSRVKAVLEFNKPLEKADWHWREVNAPGSDRPTALPFQLSEDKKSASLDLLASEGWFAVRVADEHGLSNLEEPPRNLIIIADEPPELTLSGQIETTRAKRDDVITLEALAKDDLSVAALELHIETATGQTEIKAVPAEELGGREVSHSFRLDLSAFDLADGEWLKYRVRAADNRPVPGPNEVWSDEQRIIIDPEADFPGSEEIAKRQNELRDILEAIRADLQKNLQETQKLLSEAKEKQAGGEPFEKAAELAGLEKQQREISARLEELAARFDGHRLFSNLTPETQRIAREPVREAAEELQKAQEQDQIAEKAETLKKSKQALTAADEDLEKLAKRFDELAELERDLLVIPRLAQQAQRVADQALDLSKRRDNPPENETPEQKADREADLDREEFQLDEERRQLTEALDDLLEHRPEILKAARKMALEDIAELAKRAGRLADRQDALTESLKADADQAAQEAAPIADRQAELLKKAEALKPEQKPKDASQPVDPLDPEALRKVLEDLKAGNLDAAADRQEALADGLEAMAEELKKNKDLPADPQKAAEALASRQRELQKQIADAAKNAPAENAPADEKQAFENTLKKFAGQQTGIQTGISQIDAPARNRRQHQLALNQAGETVQDLVKNNAEKAAQEAQQTADALEQLVKDIGTPEERQAKAEAEKQKAQEELQKANEARERLEELVKKQKEQAANNADKPESKKAEEELQRLMQQNADAQKKAEEELERLKKEEKLDREMNETKQSAEKKQHPQPEDVEQLAQEARAIAEEIEQLKKERAALDPEQPAKPEPMEKPEPKPAEQSAEPAAPRSDNEQPNPERAKGVSSNNQEKNSQQPNASRPNGSEENPPQAEDSKPNASDPNASRPEQSPAPEKTQKSEKNSPAPESANAEDKKVAQAGTEESSSNPSGENGSQPNAQRAEQSSEEKPAAGQSLAEKQAEQARKAAELAIRVARDQGAESAASQAATEAARKASTAREQTQDGALDRAAKTAQDSADAAKTATGELAKNTAGTPNAKDLAQEAETQAQDQSELAEALAKAAANPAERRAAQAAGQRGLKESSEKLATDLSEAADKLGSVPLNLETPGQKTEAAGHAAAQASEEMKNAQSSTAKGNAGQAASSGHKASEALRKAAGESPTPPADTPENTLVPGDLAEQVADARRRLEEAKKQLQNARKPPETQTAEAPMDEPPANEPSKPQQPMPGESTEGQTNDPGQKSPMRSGQNQSGQKQPGQNPPGQNQPGQNQPGQGQSAFAQSAQSLEQAAQSLSQAAQQMQGGVPGQSRAPGQSANPSHKPGKPGESGSDGPGNQSPIPIEQLEAVLKSQNREEWGRLPGQLRTEILQGNKQKTEGDYARLIELYSEELLKKQQAAPPKD